MALDREAFLAVLEDSYSAYYNIIKDDLPAELPMVFRADYFQRSEAFFVSRKIPMYANETNEYVYVFSKPGFTGAETEACMQYALDDGLPRVKPHKEHQYTNIKVCFLADEFDDEALRSVKQAKFQKTYNHSLWGYSNLLAVAVDVDSESIKTNFAGRDMKKYFKKLFAAQKK